MSENAWQYLVHAIILDPREPRIFMLPEAEGWSLPQVRLTEEEWEQEVGPIRLAVRKDIGLDTILLRTVRVDEDHQARRAELTVVREPIGAPPDFPVRGRWIELADLAELALAIPDQRSAIERCLREEANGQCPALRQPWARSGWFASAEAWIKQQLAHLDITPMAPVEQVRTWGISTVLVVRTSAGRIYFKAIPPGMVQRRPSARPFLFADEPTLVQALAALFPDSIRKPLAIDQERAWMLTADFGRARLPGARIETFEEILGGYARLQIASARHVDALLAAGCLDRRLDVLSAQIEPLLGDAEGLSYLTSGEVEQIQRLGPRLKDLCAELARYEVPMALVHGDLHTGNVAIHDGRHTIFDWTDACVAHPFFDLVTILGSASRFPEIPDARMRMRDAYLLQWTAYAPMERLREAADLAETLGSLHQAVSYQHIVANLELKSELSDDLQDWLREVMAVARMQSGLPAITP